MRILEHRALRGPNYYSRYQAIYMRLDIEDLEDRPSDKVPGIAEKLEAIFPSIYEHRCSVGEPGRFLAAGAQWHLCRAHGRTPWPSNCRT